MSQTESKPEYKTAVGYVSEIIGDRRTIKNNFEFKFGLAVDEGQKVNGEWVPKKVFYTIAAYNDLGRNLMATFARQPKQGVGLRLIVGGRVRDDSFRASGGYRVPRKTIVANYAGPDLNWVIAAVVPMGPAPDEDALTADETTVAQLAAVA